MLRAGDWPQANDTEMAARALETLQDRAAQTPGEDGALPGRIAALLADATVRRALDGIAGNSPHLAQMLTREVAWLPDLAAGRSETLFRAEIEAARTALVEENDRPRLMAGLRRLKRRAAVIIALADISGQWPVRQVTAALSELADTALHLACRHLLRAAAGRGALTLPDGNDPERGSGLIILGMGKLGGRELNYSSDIDLIILYDDERVQTAQPDRMAQTFIRLARDLVQIMDERTGDGYVFRTDLRLRPDPGATPLAVSVTGAENYYGSLAQNWERAAMLRARPVAGDLLAGEEFLTRIRPFVWRRNLDFAAVQDIHSIKRRIHAHRGHQAIAIEGHNVKLGRGGIRDIEFFIQTQQLVYGGRSPRLRVADTLLALDRLVEADWVDRATADQLAQSYEFLRRVEHRLQMIHDQQTHELPATAEGVAAVAIFLGFPDAASFRQRLQATLEGVETCYAALFEQVPDLPGPAGLVFTGTDDHADTLAAVAAMGFADPPKVAELVRGWLHGRYRATRSERARQLLTELAPTLLAALGRTPSPDTALARLDSFLGKLPAGIQLFTLFTAYPALLDLMAEMLGTSPRLADHLARNPILLDAVLTPGFLEELPDRASLTAELTDLLATATTYEDVLNVARRWTNDHRFRAGVQILRSSCGERESGRYLSDVAELALSRLLPAVKAEFAERHGGFGQPGLAVLALGKLGAGDMSLRSDLDLIMVYDSAHAERESDGPRPLGGTTYYARLTQRLISAITAPTAEGQLYEVDMRLRPSGNAGPVAVGLESFRRYQTQDAWTWEHMALTRARPVAGPPELCAAISGTIRAVLTAPRDTDGLLRDVAAMRHRIDKSFATDSIWEVKYVRGGLVDIDFVAQYLQLRHAAARPEILVPGSRAALERLAAAGLLEAEAARTLCTVLGRWQRIQAYLRLTVDGPFDPGGAAPALLAGLARAAWPETPPPADPTAMEVALRADAAAALAVYEAIIERPAAALPAAPDG